MGQLGSLVCDFSPPRPPEKEFFDAEQKRLCRHAYRSASSRSISPDCSSLYCRLRVRRKHSAVRRDDDVRSARYGGYQRRISPGYIDCRERHGALHVGSYVRSAAHRINVEFRGRVIGDADSVRNFLVHRYGDGLRDSNATYSDREPQCIDQSGDYLSDAESKHGCRRNGFYRNHHVEWRGRGCCLRDAR